MPLSTDAHMTSWHMYFVRQVLQTDFFWRNCLNIVACVGAMKNMKNFYDIRNQLMNSVDTEAKAKNAAFAASIVTTPPAKQRSGLFISCLFC